MFQFHVHDQSEIPFAHMVGLAASLSHHTHFAIKSKEVSIENMILMHLVVLKLFKPQLKTFVKTLDQCSMKT